MIAYQSKIYKRKIELCAKLILTSHSITSQKSLGINGCESINDACEYTSVKPYTIALYAARLIKNQQNRPAWRLIKNCRGIAKPYQSVIHGNVKL